MDLPKLDFLNFDDNKIPIPNPDFLRESYKKKGIEPSKTIQKAEDAKPKPLPKHERAYDAFCRWVALPKDERKPTTITAFEKKWKVPDKYTAEFRQREDFEDRRKRYFWEWMMDRFPDVVESIYKGAIRGSSAQAKIFAELIAKHMDIGRPAQVIQNFTLVGVEQEKIDKLFVPKGYEQVEDILPEK